MYQNVVEDEDGGYSHTFVDDKRAREFECPFCLHVVKMPILMPCGDIACKVCWKSYTSSLTFGRKKIACPVCREMVDDSKVVENKHMMRMVKSLRIFCDNKVFGCSVTFDLSDLEQHKKVCEFEPVLCDLNCASTVPRSQLTHHVQHDCPMRLQKCTKCKCHILAKDMETHSKTDCGKKTVNCNKCKNVIDITERVKQEIEQAQVKPVELKPQQEIETVVHEGYICDECGESIIGVRYRCGNCADYDLCENCEIKPNVHNPKHVFLKMKQPCRFAGKINNVYQPLLRCQIYDYPGHFPSNQRVSNSLISTLSQAMSSSERLRQLQSDATAELHDIDVLRQILQHGVNLSDSDD